MEFGLFDKNTSAEFLRDRGIRTPRTFENLDQAREWLAGDPSRKIFLRPYFPEAWDSTIFLPGLTSVSVPRIDDMFYEEFIEVHMRDSAEYLERLWQDGRLQPYLAQFGVAVDAVPKLQYLLQEQVLFPYDIDYAPEKAIAMRNGDHLHIEHISPFSGYARSRSYPLDKTPNDSSGNVDLIPGLYQQIMGVYSGNSNLQIEFVHGVTTHMDDPSWFVVQVRDFPQIQGQLIGYQSGSDVKYPIIKLYEASRTSPDYGYCLKIEDRDLFETDPFVWALPQMRRLVLTGRAAQAPLSHDVFSLILQAHINRGEVILG